MGLNSDSPGRGWLHAAISYQLLQLQRPSTNEAKSWANRGGAINNPVPQHSQGVGIVESNASFIEVQTHSEARGKGGGERTRHAIRCPGFWQKNLPHAHSEEAEWRWTVLGILCATVMPTVRIISDKKGKKAKEHLILGACTVCVAETIFFKL